MVFTRDPLHVRTSLQPFGMSVRFERDMTKGEFVRMCETLEKYAGEEHYRFEPLPERAGIKWARYPRKVPAKAVAVSSGKELRFLDRNRQASVPWPPCASRYSWEAVEDELAVGKGVYQIEMLAYGNAPRWMDWQAMLCFSRISSLLPACVGVCAKPMLACRSS
jgi:hypothetical protein